MWVRVGRGETDLATLLHVWNDSCYSMPEINDPTWIIDAGANAGYATRWFSEQFPNATIIAIEPDPTNVELLRRNVDHLSNVTIVAGALAAEMGTADLVDTGEGAWAMRVGAAGEGVGRVIGHVPCVTIASLMADRCIGRISLLKIDIEGGELEVLRASSPWIELVDAIVVELHDRFRPGCMRAFVEATSGFEVEYSRGEDSFALRANLVSL